jgi:hypothetical protein
MEDLEPIQMNLKELVCESVGWILLAQDGPWWAVLNTLMNIRLP